MIDKLRETTISSALIQTYIHRYRVRMEGAMHVNHEELDPSNANSQKKVLLD